MKSLPVLLSGVLIAATTLSTAQSRPFQHKFGELREYFAHWLAVCPNKADPNGTGSYERSCWASTYSTNQGGFFPGYRLSIHRDRFTGERSVSFVLDETGSYAQGGTTTLDFPDGSQMSFRFGSEIVNFQNTANEFTFAETAANEAVIEKLAAANHVVFRLPAKDGTQRVQFSAMGVKGALGFIERYAKP